MKNNTGSNAGPFQVKRSISAGKVASGRKQDSNDSNGKGLFQNKKASSARTFKCNSNDGKKAVEEHEDEIWQVRIRQINSNFCVENITLRAKC